MAFNRTTFIPLSPPWKSSTGLLLLPLLPPCSHRPRWRRRCRFQGLPRRRRLWRIRDVELTEKFAYSSVAALMGFSLILAVLRTFSIRDEAARVMVIAPLLAFVTTHIMYLNFYKLDYGLNTKVCFIMMISKLVLWGVWAALTRHPSRWKVWVVVIGTALSLILLAYDFSPYRRLVDSHALWHASGIPIAHLWWSFVKDDAEFRTVILMKKRK